MFCKECNEVLWTEEEQELETCEYCYQEYMKQKLEEESHPDEAEFYKRRTLIR